MMLVVMVVTRSRLVVGEVCGEFNGSYLSCPANNIYGKIKY